MYMQGKRMTATTGPCKLFMGLDPFLEKLSAYVAKYSGIEQVCQNKFSLKFGQSTSPGRGVPEMPQLGAAYLSLIDLHHALSL